MSTQPLITFSHAQDEYTATIAIFVAGEPQLTMVVNGKSVVEAIAAMAITGVADKKDGDA